MNYRTKKLNALTETDINVDFIARVWGIRDNSAAMTRTFMSTRSAKNTPPIWRETYFTFSYFGLTLPLPRLDQSMSSYTDGCHSYLVSDCFERTPRGLRTMALGTTVWSPLYLSTRSGSSLSTSTGTEEGVLKRRKSLSWLPRPARPALLLQRRCCCVDGGGEGGVYAAGTEAKTPGRTSTTASHSLCLCESRSS